MMLSLRVLMVLLGGTLLWLAHPLPAQDSGLDVEPEALASGLIAEYRSEADPQAVHLQLDTKPAVNWRDSSPHPRLPPGRFRVEWRGILFWRDPAPVQFEAYVQGELLVEVAGERVLEGRGEAVEARLGPGPPCDLEPGYYPLRIRYTSPAEGEARVQLWWQGSSFAREPLPAWQLFHRPEDAPATGREQGYLAAERFGCARCHAAAFPAVEAPPPGPHLSGLAERTSREWLLAWLADPRALKQHATMPSLFPATRAGFVDRWLLVEYLLAGRKTSSAGQGGGEHRMGRRHFVGLGCAACHLVPDVPRAEQLDLGQGSLTQLHGRWTEETLAAFLQNPAERYPDGRMPHFALDAAASLAIAAYLLRDPAHPEEAPGQEARPTDAELQAALLRHQAASPAEAARKILQVQHCAACHPGADVPGFEPVPALNLPIADISAPRGCLGTQPSVSFPLSEPMREALRTYASSAAQERHASPFYQQQRRLARAGCTRCHSRDSDRPSPLEQVATRLGGAWLEHVPYQRTPRLTFPHQKLQGDYLQATVRAGVTGLRAARYSYRMPHFGPAAEVLVRALAEGDGEHVEESEAPPAVAADPTLGTLHGPSLVGFQGYACVACHIWNGQKFADPDPGAQGPDLTRTVGRVRRSWFDRLLENPQRLHPGTAMPAVFPRGQPAPLAGVLEGDPALQRDALWSYLARGKEAPSPKPPPPLTIPPPLPGEPVRVAQIPLHVDQSAWETISVLSPEHDFFVFDLNAGEWRAAFSGTALLRTEAGRVRGYTLAADAAALWNGSALPAPEAGRVVPPVWARVGRGGERERGDFHFTGYERHADGVTIRSTLSFPGSSAGPLAARETLQVPAAGSRELTIQVHLTGLNPAQELLWRPAWSGLRGTHWSIRQGNATPDGQEGFRLVADAAGIVAGTVRMPLPAAGPAPAAASRPAVVMEPPPGSLERPGYRAVRLGMPAGPGEEPLMPSAIAVQPGSGRLFIASMKRGEIFAVDQPRGEGARVALRDYTHGLFQEAYSLLAERDALYVLHRRNLTRIRDVDQDGTADQFERVASLPQSIADAYDYGYGLVRDRTGSFVLSHAPHANQQIRGSGSVLRLSGGGGTGEELAFGLRNPLGWCVGPEQEIFFTDNQGEWVATNKLCHVMEGRFYGYPNRSRPEHAQRPLAPATVWIPYRWAHSINGLAYDDTRGGFGPFAGQFFLAELMFGGALVRADVERINGVYQGVCVPFWGPGLLGPLTLAFDAQGALYVGSITEPGWMAQPDRGALFRVDYTGELPFELLTVRVRPDGFRVLFTRPVDPATASRPDAWQLEHFRYEFTSAYGSPELDRTPLRVESARVAPDGLSVDLQVTSRATDRVYMIGAQGVRSLRGEPLVQPVAAYTLHHFPAE